MNTNTLTLQVVMFLRKNGYFVWRQNNVGVYNAKTKSYRKPPAGSIKGVPDVIGFNLASGTFIACEIKGGNDRLSTEQESFLETAKNANCEVYIVRDFESFKKEFFAFLKK